MDVMRTVNKQGYITLSIKLQNKNVTNVEITDNCSINGAIGLVFYERGIGKKYEITQDEAIGLSNLLKQIFDK